MDKDVTERDHRERDQDQVDHLQGGVVFASFAKRETEKDQHHPEHPKQSEFGLIVGRDHSGQPARYVRPHRIPVNGSQNEQTQNDGQNVASVASELTETLGHSVVG